MTSNDAWTLRLPPPFGRAPRRAADIIGKPWVTVSPVGYNPAAGILEENAGADFGPDTPGTQTQGLLEALSSGRYVHVLGGTYTFGVPIGNFFPGQVVVFDPYVTINWNGGTSFGNYIIAPGTNPGGSAGYDGCTWLGNGATITVPASNNMDVFEISPASGVGVRNPFVSNFVTPNPPAAGSIRLQAGTPPGSQTEENVIVGAVFDRIRMPTSGVASGYSAFSVNGGTRGLVFRNCEFDIGLTNAGNPWFLSASSGAADITFEKCLFAAGGKAQADFVGNSTPQPVDVYFRGCRFVAATAQGITFEDGDTGGLVRKVLFDEECEFIGSWSISLGSSVTLPGSFEVRGSGTLPTISGSLTGRYPSPTSSISANPPVSGTVYQNLGPKAIAIYLPVTYSPTSSAAATMTPALGPTSTPTNLPAESEPAGLTAGTVRTYILRVPAGWYYSFTAVNATLGTATVLTE